MPLFPTNNQFGGSPYNNPQMGAGMAGGMDYLQDFIAKKKLQPVVPGAPTPANAAPAAGAAPASGMNYTPGNYTSTYQPTNYNLGAAQANTATAGAAPTSNMYTDYMKQFMGMMGQGGNAPVTADTISAKQVQMSELGADPMKVIESLQPLINQGMNEQFAKAGQRFGAQGMLTSTPYAGELGKQSAIAGNQLSNAYYTNVLGTAKEQQQLKADLAKANQGTDLQAQMANQSAKLQAAGMNKQQADMYAQLAVQMGGLGQGQQQITNQANQFNAAAINSNNQFNAQQKNELIKFSAGLTEQSKTTAAQMGLDAFKVNEMAKQFAASHGLNWAQLDEQKRSALANEALQKSAQEQQAKQAKNAAYMQWIMGGGDPAAFDWDNPQNSGGGGGKPGSPGQY
jgi:hypothetical protein